MTRTVNQRLDRIEKELGLAGKKTTRIAVVQDKSSSMGSRQEATISGYNEYIEDLAKDDSDEAFLTLIQFDTEYNIVESGVNVKDAPKLNKDSYSPGGMTALYDVVGRAINELKKDLGSDERALVVIMTDGQENSSREFSSEQIQTMIKDCEKEGNWTFVYLGAGQDSWSGGMGLGINQSQHVLYGADSHSHSVGYAGLSAATASLRSGTSMSNEAFGSEAVATMDNLGADVHTHSTTDANGDLWTPGQKDEDGHKS